MFRHAIAIAATVSMFAVGLALAGDAGELPINPNHMFLLKRDMLTSCPPEWLHEYKLTAQECLRKLGRAKYKCTRLVVGDRTEPLTDADSSQDLVNYHLCQQFTFMGCDFDHDQFSSFMAALAELSETSAGGELSAEQEDAIASLFDKSCPGLESTANNQPKLTP